MLTNISSQIVFFINLELIVLINPSLCSFWGTIFDFDLNKQYDKCELPEDKPEFGMEWNAEHHQALDYSCETGVLTYVRSCFSKEYVDRLWQYKCGYLEITRMPAYGYQNEVGFPWPSNMSFICPHNHVIYRVHGPAWLGNTRSYNFTCEALYDFMVLSTTNHEPPVCDWHRHNPVRKKIELPWKVGMTGSDVHQGDRAYAITGVSIATRDTGNTGDAHNFDNVWQFHFCYLCQKPTVGLWSEWTPCPHFCDKNQTQFRGAQRYRERTCRDYKKWMNHNAIDKSWYNKCRCPHGYWEKVSEKCKACIELPVYEDNSLVEVEIDESPEVKTTVSVIQTTTTTATTSSALSTTTTTLSTMPSSESTTPELLETSEKVVTELIGEIALSDEEESVFMSSLSLGLIGVMAFSALSVVVSGVLLVRSIMQAFEDAVRDEQEIKQQEMQTFNMAPLLR